MCILVVEDEPLVLMSVVEQLESSGYEVLEAPHGAAAINLIERWPKRFTMLVTDHNMPPSPIKGTDLVVHMRQLYPAIPIIIATAAQNEIDVAFRQVHRVHVLPKPFELSQLADLVSGLLGPA